MTVGRIASSFDKNCADWWMMTDLLSIKWSSIDYGLIGLANERIKGFIASNVARGTGEDEPNDFEKSFQGFLLFGCCFKFYRCMPIRVEQERQIAFLVKNNDWK